MRIFQARIAGAPLEDAFIYGTRLYCWTFDKKVRIYRTVDIERALEAASPHNGAALNYALFHSRGLGASPSMVTAWRSFWLDESDNGPPVKIDGEELPYDTLRVDTDGLDVLDMLIFYNRLYLGTGAALFSIEPFDPDEPPSRLRMHARVQEACYAVSGGLGSVAASCAENGLYLLLDDNAWLAKEQRPRKAASRSFRAEIGFSSVVNHRSRGDVEFLVGHTTDTKRGRVLTEVRHAKVSSRGRAGAALRQTGYGADLALWDQSRLVVFHQGRLSSIGVARDGDVRRLTRTRELGTYEEGTTVIAAARVGRHFALETEDSVVVAGDAQPSRISTGAIISLRAYPRSKRYLRLVTATSERGLWLLAIADKPEDGSTGTLRV